MAPNPPFIDNEKPSTGKWNTGVYRYDVLTAALDVVSTTTETSVYSKSISAGDMSAERMLRLTLVGDYMNNSGGPVDITLRVKFGATTVYAGVNGVGTSDPDRAPLILELWFANLDATTQRLAGVLNFGWRGPAPTTGQGSLNFGDPLASGGGDMTHTVIGGTSAEDTTSAKTFEVTVQHGTSSAGLSFRRHFAVLELVG